MSFNRLKSGTFKGKLASKWVRQNSGAVVFTCPFCGKSLPGTCSCGWKKDRSGFRYRWIESDKIEYPFNDLGFTKEEITALKEAIEDGLTVYIEEPRVLSKLYKRMIGETP